MSKMAPKHQYQPKPTSLLGSIPRIKASLSSRPYSSPTSYRKMVKEVTGEGGMRTDKKEDKLLIINHSNPIVSKLASTYRS